MQIGRLSRIKYVSSSSYDFCRCSTSARNSIRRALPKLFLSAPSMHPRSYLWFRSFSRIFATVCRILGDGPRIYSFLSLSLVKFGTLTRSHSDIRSSENSFSLPPSPPLSLSPVLGLSWTRTYFLKTRARYIIYQGTWLNLDSLK